MSLRVGVLAEDRTDCDAIEVLMRRIVSEIAQDKSIGFLKRGTKGCARVRRKATSQLRYWARQGVTAAIVVHDLDDRDEDALRRELNKADCPPELSKLICIPAQELEAWFFSDQAVLDRITDGKARAHHNPHLVDSPKEELIRRSRDARKRPRYSTNDNAKWMAELDLAICASRCKAFASLQAFVSKLVADVASEPDGE